MCVRSAICCPTPVMCNVLENEEGVCFLRCFQTFLSVFWGIQWETKLDTASLIYEFEYLGVAAVKFV